MSERLKLTEAELNEPFTKFTLGAVLAFKSGMKERRSYVNPPENCDICEQPVFGVFYDARTVQGPWANMCGYCFRRYGVGLGTGRGQEWTEEEKGRFFKTGG